MPPIRGRRSPAGLPSRSASKAIGPVLVLLAAIIAAAGGLWPGERSDGTASAADRGRTASPHRVLAPRVTRAEAASLRSDLQRAATFKKRRRARLASATYVNRRAKSPYGPPKRGLSASAREARHDTLQWPQARTVACTIRTWAGPNGPALPSAVGETGDAEKRCG